MSSYPICDYMLKLHILGDPITISYTCPRCGRRQAASIHPGDLLFGRSKVQKHGHMRRG